MAGGALVADNTKTFKKELQMTAMRPAKAVTPIVMGPPCPTRSLLSPPLARVITDWPSLATAPVSTGRQLPTRPPGRNGQAIGRHSTSLDDGLRLSRPAH